MLVKFRTKTGTPIEEDSSNLLLAGEDVFLVSNPMIRWEINKSTRDYISNAKLHEGMRRVKTREYFGWCNGIVTTGCAPCFVVEQDDDSIGIWNFDAVTFIPYEMEEQK